MTISLKNFKKVISEKADKYFTEEHNQLTTANLDKELLIKFITKRLIVILCFNCLKFVFQFL